MDLMLYSGRPEPSLLRTVQQLEPVCWAAICLLKTGPTGVWPNAHIFILYHQTSFHKRRLFWLKPSTQRRWKTGWESGLCSVYAKGEDSVFRRTQILSSNGINPTGGATQLDIFNLSYLDKH